MDIFFAAIGVLIITYGCFRFVHYIIHENYSKNDIDFTTSIKNNFDFFDSKNLESVKHKKIYLEELKNFEEKFESKEIYMFAVISPIIKQVQKEVIAYCSSKKATFPPKINHKENIYAAVERAIDKSLTDYEMGDPRFPGPARDRYVFYCILQKEEIANGWITQKEADQKINSLKKDLFL
ncbi:MAG: hypothetical protein RSA61_07710 [Acidaminococcaceae bacterium]